MQISLEVVISLRVSTVATLIIRKTCVFVGGPIQHAMSPAGDFHRPTRTVIEAAIAGLKDEGYKVLSAHVHEKFGEMDVSDKFQEVCSRDYAWMRQCDVFVAILPLNQGGKVIHSAGTSVELGWASAMGKPIVLVCDPTPIYSHLVIGLDAVARVAKLDINLTDLPFSICEAIKRLLSDEQAIEDFR